MVSCISWQPDPAHKQNVGVYENCLNSCVFGSAFLGMKKWDGILLSFSELISVGAEHNAHKSVPYCIDQPPKMLEQILFLL